MSRFDQKIVLIVGEPDEVAIATGKKMAGQDAVITLCGDNSCNQLENASASIRLSGNDTDWIHSELSGADDAGQIINYIMEKHGHLDILVVNLAAHAMMRKAVGNGFDTAPHQAVIATMNLIEDAIPALQKSDNGRIINVGSIDYLGAPGKPALSSAYSSLFGLTRSLALRAAKDGLTVNSVVMGDIETPPMAEEEIKGRLSSIPVKRMGQPDDVANANSFFAADSAKDVTGKTFFVCGGKSMHYSMSI